MRILLSNVPLLIPPVWGRFKNLQEKVSFEKSSPKRHIHHCEKCVETLEFDKKSNVRILLGVPEWEKGTQLWANEVCSSVKQTLWPHMITAVLWRTASTFGTAVVKQKHMQVKETHTNSNIFIPPSVKLSQMPPNMPKQIWDKLTSEFASFAH